MPRGCFPPAQPSWCIRDYCWGAASCPSPEEGGSQGTFPLRLQVNCLRRYSQINYRVIYRSAPATPRSFARQRTGAGSPQQDGCRGPGSPRGGRRPVPIPARGTRSSRRRPRPHGTTESELLFPTTTAPAPWKRRGRRDGGDGWEGAATGRRRPATGCPGPPRARVHTVHCVKKRPGRKERRRQGPGGRAGAEGVRK